jgi:hypothetical protein
MYEDTVQCTVQCIQCTVRPLEQRGPAVSLLFLCVSCMFVEDLFAEAYLHIVRFVAKPDPV